jgi:hypothetical protein
MAQRAPIADLVAKLDAAVGSTAGVGLLHMDETPNRRARVALVLWQSLSANLHLARRRSIAMIRRLICGVVLLLAMAASRRRSRHPAWWTVWCWIKRGAWRSCGRRAVRGCSVAACARRDGAADFVDGRSGAIRSDRCAQRDRRARLHRGRQREIRPTCHRSYGTWHVRCGHASRWVSRSSESRCASGTRGSSRRDRACCRSRPRRHDRLS